MKAVMLSIQPKWCELIASGKKTIEVRKTRPQIETPFKCYIYETKGLCDTPTFIDEDGHISYRGRGAVIGEFVCDRIEKFNRFLAIYDITASELTETCLSIDEFYEYGKGKTLYGLHISELKIYDKPKELGEFFSVCHKLDCDKCGDCPHLRVEPCTYPCDDDIEVWCEVDNCKPLTRPPQSWCYVEEIL